MNEDSPDNRNKEMLKNLSYKVVRKAYTSNAKKCVKVLLQHCENFNDKWRYTNKEFKVSIIKSRAEMLRATSSNFDLLRDLINDKEFKENPNILIDNYVFTQIALIKNLDFYTECLNNLPNAELRDKAVKQSLHHTIGSKAMPICEYKLFTYIAENYSHIFTKEDKQKIIHSAVLSSNKERLKELEVYPFLFEGIDPNVLLRKAIEKIESPNTLEYIEKILSYKYEEKINIHDSYNYYFKQICQKISMKDPQKAIETIAITMLAVPDMNIEEIIPLFENEYIIKFLEKALLSQSLNESLQTKVDNHKNKSPKI